MSEKPKFERPLVSVYGKISEETKTKIATDIGKRFREGAIKDFSENFVRELAILEYDKRPYERDFINESNRILNEILEKCGLEAFNVPEKNIHIVPPEIFRKAGYNPGFSAVQDTRRQLAAFNAEYTRATPFRIAGEILHEMTHLKGFVSFEAEEKGNDEKRVEEEEKDKKSGDKFNRSARRIGYVVFGSYRKSHENQYAENFRGLNEAVVSFIEEKFRERE